MQYRAPPVPVELMMSSEDRGLIPPAALAATGNAVFARRPSVDASVTTRDDGNFPGWSPAIATVNRMFDGDADMDSNV